MFKIKKSRAIALLLTVIMALSSLSVNVFADNTFGSAGVELTKGVYDLPVKMMKAADISSPSMAGSCIAGGQLEVTSGQALVIIDLQPVSVFGLTSWASDWQVYSNGVGSELKPVEETRNSEGNVEKITLTLTDTTRDGVYVNIFVPALGMTQDAYLAFDYSSLATAEKVYTGKFHIDQFGEYDIVSRVTVKEGVITDLEVSGENFGGTYAHVNEIKLKSAFEGLKNLIVGLLANDRDKIYNVDAVSGATYSSKGISASVMNALSLEAPQEEISLPTEKLTEGKYKVDIALYSDAVYHSLVENDKAEATINVDSKGNMTLVTDIINGTKKEPLYILDVKGYYKNNDISQGLTAENMVVTKGDTDYSDKVFEKGTKVVTGLELPLTGEIAKIYNLNASMYVPAMNNLNGNVGGVYFENGVFSVDCFAKIYWDSLVKVEDNKQAFEIEDGTYKGNFTILKENEDTASSAGRSFELKGAPVIAEGGNVEVRLYYSTPMLTKIEQKQGDSYTELVPVEDSGKKYVAVDFDDLNSVQYLQLTVNTPIGVMVHIVRLVADTATIERVETTTETTTEATTESTTEATTETTSTTESTTVTTTESTTKLTTESTTATTTESTTKATTESTTITETTTKVTTVITTESSTTTEVTTESTTQTTTEGTTKVTTESTTAATTEATTEVNTEKTTEATTEITTEATTEKAKETTTKAVKHSSGGGGSSKKASQKAELNKNSDEITENKADNADKKADTKLNNSVSISIGNKNAVIGDKTYTMEVAPYIQLESASTLVPLRFVALALMGEDMENSDTNKNIIWNPDTKTVTIVLSTGNVTFTADSNLMVINNVPTAMDNNVRAEIKNGRMFIPFRALGKALGADVKWDSDTKTAVYSLN